MSFLTMLATLGQVFKATDQGKDSTLINKAAEVIDVLYTSDKEQLDRSAALARLMTKGDDLQARINRIEGQHRSLLVAGWRPFIGWICGLSLAWHFLLLPMMEFILLGFGVTLATTPQFDLGTLNTILFGMLGLGTLRTAEKAAGRA